MSYSNQTAINDEIEHLEADLKYLQDNNADTESLAYKDIERRLQEAYQNLDKV